MDDLTRFSLESFLDRTADRTPTPGGGSVTAVAGALACALARMVIAYSGRKDAEQAAANRTKETALRLHCADQLLRALISQDAAAYADMTDAAKHAKENPSNPSARSACNDAVLAAVAVPMEMAAIAVSALAEMDEFKTVAGRYLLSDLAIAAVLADAAARSARYTVGVNARELDDTGKRARILADIDDILEHCARRRESIESYVRGRLENAAPAGR